MSYKNADLDNTQSPQAHITGNYATLDQAFRPTQTMSDFQHKMTDSACSSSRRPSITQQSEENINDGIDELIGIYDRDAMLAKHQLQLEPRTDGIKFPLDRNAKLPGKMLGSEIMEKYTRYSNGSNFWRYFLIVLLIVVVFYGIYHFVLKKNSQSLSKAPVATFNGMNNLRATNTFY